MYICPPPRTSYSSPPAGRNVVHVEERQSSTSPPPPDSRDGADHGRQRRFGDRGRRGLGDGHPDPADHESEAGTEAHAAGHRADQAPLAFPDAEADPAADTRAVAPEG